MTERYQISVRALVEFTCHGDDIRPGGSLTDMQNGILGHKARQAMLEDGWQSEVTVSNCFQAEGDDFSLVVSGRIDALLMAQTPVIEEIKVWKGKHPPLEAQQAHRLQAVCYGYMLLEQTGQKEIAVRVAYVNTRGNVIQKFEEILSDAQCRKTFLMLIENYLRRIRILRNHLAQRNESLRQLSFPFEQYRAGQREMAVQVFTAIQRGKRLYAEMPTGTGKSSATLFPALKALGEGLTGQVYYLTARTTQRQGPVDALKRMRLQSLHLWSLVLDAKQKQCPTHTVCHPDWCPRAKGHFLRDGEALDEMFAIDHWSPDVIAQMCEKHQLCPFEFSLTLCQYADLVVCDYNYALDPAAHIQRVFDRTNDVTLLIDEAHNLLSRARDMLGGEIVSADLRKIRIAAGKTLGKKHSLYQSLTQLIYAMVDLPVDDEALEGRLSQPPRSLDVAVQDVCEQLIAARMEKLPWNEAPFSEVLMSLLGFVRARRRAPEDYAFLWHGNEMNRVLQAYALNISDYLRQTTAKMSGTIFFSATMTPLNDMKNLLGGEEEDVCFSMPSPFQPSHLLLQIISADNRYHSRQATASAVAEAIVNMVEAHSGHYMVFFPSFAYMEMVAQELKDIPFQVQKKKMTDAQRADFLQNYTQDGPPTVSLCVMGGVFSEGIDLPGKALDGVMIVGVGLPQVGQRQETLKAYYDQTIGNGFRYAYQIPGMQKVAQAVGRVIRTEKDIGIAVLMDVRYNYSEYRSLFPPHWQISGEASKNRTMAFWKEQTDEHPL